MGVKKHTLSIGCLLAPLLLSACGDVEDEAATAGRDASSFRAASENYFKGIDDENVTPARQKAGDEERHGIELTRAEIKGRNTWMVWTGGNDRFWDYFARHSFGTFDLLKVISSGPYSGFCYRLEEKAKSEKDCRKLGGHWYVSDGNRYKEFCGVHVKKGSNQKRFKKGECPNDSKWYSAGRSNRWKWYGLVNEPCFEEAEGRDEYGLWLDRRKSDCSADPFANEAKYPGVKIGARGKTVPLGSYYGKPSGVVGLRLFSNPDFNEEAKKNGIPSVTMRIRFIIRTRSSFVPIVSG
jgi:hypothetical protein